MRFHFVLLALLAVGCDSANRADDMAVASDGNVDESPLDSGQPTDESPSTPDAGDAPNTDGGGEDADPGVSPFDASVGDGDGDGDRDGDVDGDGTVGICAAELDEPATFGTAEDPIELAAGDVTIEGTIDWRGRAFARINGVASGTRYVISATAASQLMLAAFTEDTTFTEAACVSGDQVTERDALCIVTATRESIDVAIDARDVADTFALTIRPAYASEGTADEPVVLASDVLPYELEVNSEDENYYEITGLTAWTPYVVSIRAPADGVILDVYESALGFGGSVTDKQALPDASAIGTPQTGSLFVALRGASRGTTAQLDVRPATHASEGTAAAPIAIAASALPFHGEVGWTYNPLPALPLPPHVSTESHYTITGLSPGSYVVKLDDATARVRVLLDDDGSMSSASLPNYVRANRDVPARIATRVTGSTLDIIVQNQGGAGTTFTLDLEPAMRTSVGAESAPLQIPLADFPYSGQIEPNIYSYYEVTGLEPGQKYLARATNVAEAPVGVLFVDESTNQACEIQAQTGTSDQTCTFVPSGSSARFQARVFGYTHAAILGSVFTLSLEPIVEESVGSPSTPIVIECDSGSYTGQIGTNGESYYEIRGLSPGATYFVEATPHDDDAIINVFADGGEYPFAGTPCMGYGSSTPPARCVNTSVAGSLFVHVIGYARGQAFELSWRPSATGSEGTESTPVALALEDLPYAGNVSGEHPSFYTLAGLVPGTEYVVRLAPVEEILDVNVHATAAFDSDLVGLGPVFPGAPFVRTFTASETTVALKVALPVGADGSSAFELDLTPQQ